MSGFTELYSDNPISENELTSVHALIAYTAHVKNISADTIREIVKTKFDAPDITKLRRRDYDNAVSFLIDLEVGEILN